MARYFDIEVIHYADDGVWAATSEDIKGLTVEAPSLQTFLETLIEVSIDLLTHNHGLSDAEIEASTIRVKHLRHVRDETRAKPIERRRHGSHLKLMFNDARELADVADAA